MIAALEKRNLKLTIAHQTRYSPALAHAREAMTGGLLGDILELRGRGKEDARGGGEDLMVLGTHVMDLMRFFAGDPSPASPKCANGAPHHQSDARGPRASVLGGR
jgi:predicted dehydrogenase